MTTISPKIEHRCLLCGSELPGPLFEIANMPCGAQSMPDKDELASDSGIDLKLCRCGKCGLVQFDCEPVDYYATAVRVVGLSETMKELRRSDYRLLIDKYGRGGGRKWLECGCGNGDFLKVLTEFDADLYGMEHGSREYAEAVDKLCSAEVQIEKYCETDKTGKAPSSSAEGCGNAADSRRTAASVDRNHIMQLFAADADMDIPGAPFDVFLSFNFLEHQPDPVSMLKCMHRNLTDDGIGLITVPSFEYILEKGRYYELVRDHIANYDMSSLRFLCEYCDFEVLEEGRIGIGDTLRAVVRKKETSGGAGVSDTAPETETDASREAGTAAAVSGKNAQYNEHTGNETVRAAENCVSADEGSDISILKADYERMKQDIAGYMGDLKRKGRSAALWGAGHQGFTIASTTAFKDHIRYIIDSSPRKQGRFAPASHLRIVPPEEYLTDPVDVIIIAAPGYVREIEADIRQRYSSTHVGVPAICSILELTER